MKDDVQKSNDLNVDPASAFHDTGEAMAAAAADKNTAENTRYVCTDEDTEMFLKKKYIKKYILSISDVHCAPSMALKFCHYVAPSSSVV